MIRLLALALLLASPAAACRAPPHEHRAVPGSLSTLLPPDAPLQFARRPGPSSAWYAEPTNALGHGIMGDVPDARRLEAYADGATDSCGVVAAEAGPGHVFEDTAPRLHDVDGDGRAEVIAVRSSLRRGAQLVIYAQDGAALVPMAATPPIGRRHRWLAPVGIADLDGDGHVEIAFVDRPHLARTLRIWRWADGRFFEVATVEGVTNHRIGEETIAGGLRDCSGDPALILASADWSAVVAVRLARGRAVAERIAGRPDRAGFERALACD